MDARAATEMPAESRAVRLERALGEGAASTILSCAILDVFPGRIALASSFGADSAVLLHMIAAIDPATPVLFLDTGKLFAETLAYRDTLLTRLGLRNVRRVSPTRRRLGEEDPTGYLHTVEPDACCHLRKVEPLEKALGRFDAWITGRKRFQGALRAELAVFEADGPRIKINPLAAWSPADIEAYFTAHDLPRHPLVAHGYLSIGCSTCTLPVKAGEEQRAGRWRGRGKTECGIHMRKAG